MPQSVVDSTDASQSQDFDVDPAAFGLTDGDLGAADAASSDAAANNPPVADQPVADAPAQSSPAAPPAGDPPPQGQAAAAAQQQAETNALLALAREQFGYQGDHPNDMAFLQHLMQTQHEYQRAMPDLQAFRQVQPYLSQFSQFMQQQRAAQQQQAQTDPWGRPEYDPRWETLLEQDEQGGVRLRKGVVADPSIPAKYAAAVEHRTQFLQNLWREPEKTLAPLMQNVAQQVLQSLQGEFAQRDQHQTAAEIVRENADWIFANKATRQLSPRGERFAQLVEHFDKRVGVADPKMQYQLASQQLELEELRAQKQTAAQPPAAAQQRQAANQQFLQQSNGAVRRPSASASGAGPAAGPMTLADMVRQQVGGQTIEYDRLAYEG